ncbi:molecular chaperone DnaK [Muricomes intestini]|uniref:Chaperone protein DnaK n=1 Tax=Muricomes intestini TaxID=1796634 RepID=A0A4V2USE4_9FIRM|nr:Hsp70 family protein [Muricomes intestini]TCS81102.1 molecular chaperone DnaK [Muricomes intestini]
MKRVIGIDLGTSTSEAAVMLDGVPFIIPNERQNAITPSVIGRKEGRFIAGEEADERKLLYPQDTSVEVKRLMGSGERIRLSNKFYTPEELSAKLLVHIKAYAETYLKEPVDSAVITVPAYFNNEQRKATIEAGRQAGLSVERIINEPTAAALCYGIEHIAEESRILVYDFGGGTFDVTVLEMFDGVLEVKASSGNNELGGKEFDQRLIDYLLYEAREKYQVDLSKDIYAMVKLREAAIKCKIALSSQKEYKITLPMIAVSGETPVTLEETITAGMFEEMTADLVELTRKPIETALSDSGYTESDIDLILLTGGTTRIPYIGRYVEELLGRKPEKLIDPDLAVAMGAAVQAAALSGELDPQKDIMITDVAPYALGIRVMTDMYGIPFDNYMDILIPRNTTIPVTKTKRYSTAADNQREAIVEVYQGEKEFATENVSLGEFCIGEFPRARAGKEKIDVEFSYDLNGILVVTAVVVSTGEKAHVSIDMKEAKEPEYIDISEWSRAPMARKFRATVRKAEKWLAEQEYTPDSIELEEILTALKEAIVLGRDVDEAEDIEAELLGLLDR